MVLNGCAKRILQNLGKHVLQVNWNISWLGRENNKSVCEIITYAKVASGFPFTTISGLVPIVALHSSFTNEPHSLEKYGHERDGKIGDVALYQIQGTAFEVDNTNTIFH